MSKLSDAIPGDPDQYRWLTVGGPFNISVWLPGWVTARLGPAAETEYGPGDGSQAGGFIRLEVMGNVKFEGRGLNYFRFDQPGGPAQFKATAVNVPAPANELKIAWWNGSQWIVLPRIDDGTTNTVIVQITEIGDPPISWGR